MPEFVVGTQINGAPHLGTNLVQSSAFLLAQQARRTFRTDTAVRFSALDNAPYDITLDPETHHAYQQTYLHALGKDGVADLVEGYYRPFFDSLSDATDVEYATETYSDQQAGSAFRAEFLRTLEVLDDLKWWLNPSTGVVHTRLPWLRTTQQTPVAHSTDSSTARLRRILVTAAGASVRTWRSRANAGWVWGP